MAARMMIMKKMKMMTACHRQQQKKQQHKQTIQQQEQQCKTESLASVYSTRHLSSAEDKNFPFCPHLRTRKTYVKQALFSKPSTMAYLTMVVLPSWQLLTQY